MKACSMFFIQYMQEYKCSNKQDTLALLMGVANAFFFSISDIHIHQDKYTFVAI